jgi:hypothetical protein
MKVHDLNFVRDAFFFDQTLMRTKEGWHHEIFLIFQSMFTSEKVWDFNVDRVSSRLAPISRSRTRFLFHLLAATDETTVVISISWGFGFVPWTSWVHLEELSRTFTLTLLFWWSPLPLFRAHSSQVSALLLFNFINFKRFKKKNVLRGWPTTFLFVPLSRRYSLGMEWRGKILRTTAYD